MTDSEYKDFEYNSSKELHMHHRFVPPLLNFCQPITPGTRVLDVGCGNGALCAEFIRRDCEVVGVDLSTQGIGIARASHPKGRFELLKADSEVLENLKVEPFDLVVSTEVVEHLYSPREWALGCFMALKPGGRLICSTPYHGYWKNLVLSLLGRWDKHADPLWDGGHIKLWSRRSLSALLIEAGFEVTDFKGVGRFPGLWMTMLVVAEKPMV
jgi:2-polyprenyl-6-hydroxyphenyl methylase/3-demethylubiquinone-9 3-methyltransferase